MDLIAQRAAREDRARDLRDASEAILAIERLHQLIADLLDAERLEQGLFALRRTSVDLVTLTRETAGLLHDSTEIRVHTSGAVNILADPSKPRQALENLITNAVQHSPPGKPVAMTVEAERQAGAERAIVTIGDQGPGIPPERMPFLFQRYQSGNGSNGLGLRLFLAREIARAHGGTLTADSRPGKGARFRLSLPIRAMTPVAVPRNTRGWSVAANRQHRSAGWQSRLAAPVGVGMSHPSIRAGRIDSEQ
jgi:two-component system OmpR family sensor kinase